MTRFSRRKVLTLLAGGTVVAAGAGVTGFASTRIPKNALEPWQAAGGYNDPRKQALSYAVLAPSAHNRQPWLAELTNETEIILWRDTSRELPQTDPFQRQLTISMGTFLELFDIAAAQTGHRVETRLFPEGEEGGPIARLRLNAAAVDPDPLFAAILDRRTSREPYADTAIESSKIEALGAIAQIHTAPKMVADLKALIWEGVQIETETPRTHQESVRLMRLGKAEINARPDGISVGGPFLEGLMLAGLLTREGLMDTNSSTNARYLMQAEAMVGATPAFASLSTPGNSRADQVAAGRAWMRLHLSATAKGLSLHPMSQPLQEYPEMSNAYARAHRLLANKGETVQMLARLGYGPQTPQSPRWPMETRLTHA